jgi:hypothetical protein
MRVTCTFAVKPATRGGVTLIGVTLGTPGDNISDTGLVATKVLNWGLAYF